MDDPAAKRTIRPNGPRIVELIRARGWSQEKLMREAGIQSKKTISTAEQSRPIYLHTLRLLATALDVDVVTLLPQAPSREMKSGPRRNGHDPI